MSIINIYAGYYEIYVTNKKLNKPYTLIYQAATATEANAYLMDVDDHILLDEDLKGIEFYNVLITIKNGLPVLIEEGVGQ